MLKQFSLFILVSYCTIVNGQNKQKAIVAVTKKDSVELLKKDENLFLKFFFINNINYNKSQNKKKLAGGYTVCEKCKKEYYTISVIPIKKPNLNFKKISVQDFLYKNNGYADFIVLQNKYYRYNGRIID